jgi:hypothetical protein
MTIIYSLLRIERRKENLNSMKTTILLFAAAVFGISANAQMVANPNLNVMSPVITRATECSFPYDVPNALCAEGYTVPAGYRLVLTSASSSMAAGNAAGIKARVRINNGQTLKAEIYYSLDNDGGYFLYTGSANSLGIVVESGHSVSITLIRKGSALMVAYGTSTFTGYLIPVT